MINELREAWRRLRSPDEPDLEEEDPDGFVYVGRRKVRRAAPKVDEMPDLARKLEEYRERLCAIVEVLKRRGVRLVFVTQPVLWDESISPGGERLLWMGSQGDGTFLSTVVLRSGMIRFNDVLREVCQRSGVQCIELESMHGRHEYYYDDCHFNERGAERVAELVANGFIERGSGSRWAD
jgi:hypothetical protein